MIQHWYNTDYVTTLYRYWVHIVFCTGCTVNCTFLYFKWIYLYNVLHFRTLELHYRHKGGRLYFKWGREWAAMMESRASKIQYNNMMQTETSTFIDRHKQWFISYEHFSKGNCLVGLIFEGTGVFRCASISCFQVVTEWVSKLVSKQ